MAGGYTYSKKARTASVGLACMRLNFGAYIGKGHTYDLQHSAAGVVPHRVSTRVMVGVHVFLIAYIWIIQNMVV